jgi:hypothetical protein
MKYAKTCDHCGHAEVAYSYVLNKSLVVALRRLVDFYEKNKKAVALKDLNLTNSQYGNFAHMQYFGLMRPTPEGWYPSPEGIAFIYGEMPVVMPVGVMAGEVLPLDHEAWESHETEPREFFIKDIDETSYKQRAEFAAEKASATTLL